MSSTIAIDGGRGEGGGQILRTSLGLSLATGQPFRIRGIRAGRAKPGLLRQHLTAVLAAQEIGAAEVSGAALGSTELEFRPVGVKGGEYRFAIGSAGSATLVVQTVLPALLVASAPSRLVVEGGTHNPFAPPAEFFERSFARQLARLGARVESTLERHGFFPAGGGRIVVEITPATRLEPDELLARGALRARRACALVSNLSPRIAERELAVVRHRLDWSEEECVVRQVRDASGPGNVLTLELEHEHVTEIVSGFGEKSVTARAVAERAVEELRRYERHDAPVGEHLADQLLVPFALAGAGAFRCGEPSEHTRTNAEVVERFLPVRVRFTPEPAGTTCVHIERA